MDKLAIADDAAFNSGGTRSPCHHRTRARVLEILQAWAADPNEKQIFWLNGHAGSGKSTIAQSFAELLRIEGLLGASFGDGRRDTGHIYFRKMPKRLLNDVVG